MKINRQFILGAALFFCFFGTGFKVSGQMPAYLKEYSEEFSKDPRKANLQWFKDARFGMFIHYGLYSQLGKGEWVQLLDIIPLDEYAKLKDHFIASGLMRITSFNWPKKQE
jgi:alpha-L-fucosidase